QDQTLHKSFSALQKAQSKQKTNQTNWLFKKRDPHDRDVQRPQTKQKIWHYHKQNTLLSSQTTPPHRSPDSHRPPDHKGITLLAARFGATSPA
ncbi:MAG: hypothetical protein ACK4UY_12360, partial [Dietzia sp.]